MLKREFLDADPEHEMRVPVIHSGEQLGSRKGREREEVRLGRGKEGKVELLLVLVEASVHWTGRSGKALQGCPRRPGK